MKPRLRKSKVNPNWWICFSNPSKTIYGFTKEEAYENWLYANKKPN